MRTTPHFRTFLSFYFLFVFFGYLRASHIVGGELTYECLGNNQYRIALDIYRDCYNGNPNAYFDDPARIGLFNSSNLLLQTFDMPFSGMDDTLSVILSDPCFVEPGDVCVHTTHYEKIVNLPPIPGGYVLSYQRCCRNQTISNIWTPDEVGMTLTLYISEASMLDCNSSPDFTFLPPVYVCANQPISFDHSAVDPEGDSLVYKLCTPLHGASPFDPYPLVPSSPPYDSVPWIDPPYNVFDMLGSSNDPLTIDSQTGLLTGTPEVIGQFVVGVCVEEYRNGELFTAIRRDFQYNVRPCGQTVAAFFSEEVQCNDLTVSFINQSITELPNYLWYFEYPNTSIFSTAENPVHTYPDVGTYTVALIVNPGESCVDTFMQEIHLEAYTAQAEIMECTGGTFSVALDFAEPHGPGEFTVEDQFGNDLGTFSYDALPAIIGPLASDVGYVLNIQDLNFNSCSASVSVGPVVCAVACNATTGGPVCSGEPLSLFESGGEAMAWLWSSDGTATISDH